MAAREPRACRNCGEMFVPPHGTKKGIFCSLECRDEGYSRIRLDRERKVLARLEDGPASLADLARTIWGEEWEWPATYRKCLANTIFILRKTHRIEWLYHLMDDEAEASQKIKGALDQS